LKASPLVAQSRAVTVRDGDQEEDVWAPALVTVVPRAIPVATGDSERAVS
jgi:hypothetical protein